MKNDFLYTIGIKTLISSGWVEMVMEGLPGAEASGTIAPAVCQMFKERYDREQKNSFSKTKKGRRARCR